LLILFIPASCTSDLQPLDVGFNGPWKVMITKFAGKWLTEYIQEQLRVDPDPTKITIGMKKSDLVEPFCGWIAAATTDQDQNRDDSPWLGKDWSDDRVVFRV
jgi:hypothetical protein